MNIREEIVAKIQHIPEGRLPEVYELVEKIAEDSETNALEKLQKIRISAAPEFSVRADLYSMEERDE